MHRKRNVKVLSHLFKCTGKVGKIDGKKDHMTLIKRNVNIKFDKKLNKIES